MKMSHITILNFICLIGLFPIAASAQLIVSSADGSEVTDTKTNLIWRRCPEGMAWSAGTGTCTGTALALTHEGALQQAAAQTGTLGWRLPNVKELSSIVDKTVINPAIDSAIFPATPASLFWSSSPFVTGASSAWVVDFGAGVVGGSGGLGRNDTKSHYSVRLVRGGL